MPTNDKEGENAMDPRRCNCKYEYTRQFGQPKHTWSLVGARGAVHLHITDSGDDKHPDMRYHGGLELHLRQSPDDRPPNHERCWLLHGPCWHDGSSLAASEKWIPIWLAAPHDHDVMFTTLAMTADDLLRTEDGYE